MFAGAAHVIPNNDISDLPFHSITNDEQEFLNKTTKLQPSSHRNTREP